MQYPCIFLYRHFCCCYTFFPFVKPVLYVPVNSSQFLSFRVKPVWPPMSAIGVYLCQYTREIPFRGLNIAALPEGTNFS